MKIWALVITLMAAGLAGCAQAQVPAPYTWDWIATGDSARVGTAMSQEIRWSTVKPDTTGLTAWLNGGGRVSTAGTLSTAMPAALRSWWTAATRVTSMPAPRPAGSAETFTLVGTFQPGSYYSMLQVCNQSNVCVGSNLSTRVVAVPPPAPAPVLTFKVRGDTVMFFHAAP